MRILSMIASFAVVLMVSACGEEEDTTGEGEAADAPQTSQAPDTSQPNDEGPRTAIIENPKDGEPHPLGEPRDDLVRFFGIYGSPVNIGDNLFVTRAKPPADSDQDIPGGYLMIGSMKDAPSWYMKSVSETKFEQQWVDDSQAGPLIVEFEVGPNGRALALKFETLFADRGRLPRIRNVPIEWR